MQTALLLLFFTSVGYARLEDFSAHLCVCFRHALHGYSFICLSICPSVIHTNVLSGSSTFLDFASLEGLWRMVDPRCFPPSGPWSLP